MRLRRSPVPFWVLAVALALATGLAVARLAGEAAARADRLGGLVDVPVATRPVAVGAVLRGADVEVRSLPAAAVPRGPVAPSPAGRVAVVPLAPGEVVLAAKLAPEGLAGVAALVPPGHRALAVPVDRGGLSLRPGHRVDVLATFDVAGEEAAGAPTFPVARAALVVDAGEETVTVAVTPDEAPRVAFALARGAVTLALAGP
ncbi:MAG: Flp pilus assembly protein CpaB [Acidimicrobiia bacterium]